MPAGGSVRIDGAELSHWDAQELGKYIGYLPQDVELFSGTVAENVSRFDMSDEGKIIQAARMAGVHDIIQSFPEGYNTQIGDGGYVLSGGQRQRIGLARAIFGMPSIIVLDEPNANLDSDGEAALVRSLQQLREAKRTVVLITHKTNILAIADKVLFLAGGQVQAFGSRDEVLAKVLGPRIAQLPSQGGGQPAPPTAPPAVARG
jgi:ABC-type protease/lipase transport system fused ATPase/permease subunit